MKLFQAPLLNKLSLKYRCSVNKLKYKPSLFLFNWLHIYLTTYFVDKKPTILCDHHIVGNNIIANLLLLYFIGEETKLKNQNVSIVLTIPSNNDYWKYSLIQNPILYETISEIVQENIPNFQTFLNFVTRKIPLNKTRILYQHQTPEWSRYDHYIKEYLFSFNFSENAEYNPDKNQSVSDIILAENDILKTLEKDIFTHLNKFGLLELIDIDKKYKSLKIFSKKTHLTSFPDGWLSMETFQDERDKSIIKFSHSFSQLSASYLTANEITSEPSMMEKLSIEQLKEIPQIYHK